MVSRDLDLILFDLDGTLTDSGPGILSCIEYALEDQGIPFPTGMEQFTFILDQLIR